MASMGFVDIRMGIRWSSANIIYQPETTLPASRVQSANGKQGDQMS
jgi:hypothetical protein